MSKIETTECVQRKRLIEFAPLCIPWSRRLETFGALSWLFLWSFPVLGPLLLIYVLLYTSYWYFGLAYITWLIYDRNIGRLGGRRFDVFRNLRLWKWYCNYFPIRLVKTTELDPSRNYLMVCHPHGILCSGIYGNFASEGTNVSQVFPGIKITFHTLDLIFRIPVFRDGVLACGGCSVSRGGMNFLLSKSGVGNGLIFTPGGGREMLYSAPGTDIVYLKKRKGFIKVAIENGAPLVPIYSFGETDIYSQLKNPKGSWLRNFQDKCTDLFGGVPVLVLGRGIFQYSFGFLPRRCPITSVVGAPISVELQANPSQEYIDEVHAKYMTALTDMFYAHRDKYGRVNSELLIV